MCKKKLPKCETQLSANSPHAIRGLVLQVPVELRNAQHGLRQRRREAHGLHEGRESPEEEHEDAAEHGQAQDALHVRLEVGPLPEVAQLKVWNVRKNKIMRKK